MLGNGPRFLKGIEEISPDDYVRFGDVPEDQFWELRYATIDGHKWLITTHPLTHELIAVHPRVGIEFTYGDRCKDVTRPDWHDEPVARVIGDKIYPYGSVAQHFMQEQRKFEAEQKKVGTVYFIQAMDGGPVKIGFSRDPKVRRKAFQTGHSQPLRILATIHPATIAREHEIHRQFATDRITGEWFHPSDDILKFISESALANVADGVRT